MKNVTFPPLESWNPQTRVASLVAETSAGRILCTVSAEVLDTRFRLDTETPLVTVMNNRATLEHAARKLLEGRTVEANERVAISLEDLTAEDAVATGPECAHEESASLMPDFAPIDRRGQNVSPATTRRASREISRSSPFPR